MRVKTSITLDERVLHAVDRLAGRSSRSRIIEEAVRRYLRDRSKASRDARDREIYARHADQLNEEMEAIIELQAES